MDVTKVLRVARLLLCLCSNAVSAGSVTTSDTTAITTIATPTRTSFVCSDGFYVNGTLSVLGSVFGYTCRCQDGAVCSAREACQEGYTVQLGKDFTHEHYACLQAAVVASTTSTPKPKDVRTNAYCSEGFLYYTQGASYRCGCVSVSCLEGCEESQSFCRKGYKPKCLARMFIFVAYSCVPDSSAVSKVSQAEKKTSVEVKVTNLERN